MVRSDQQLRGIHGSHIEHLSEEVLLEILSYLSIAELLTTARVSRRFNRLSDEPLLWRRIYHALFTLDRLKHPFSPAVDQRLRSSIESRYSQTHQVVRKGKKKDSEENGAHLGHTWRTLCRISLNWKTGSAGLTRITPIINNQPESPSSDTNSSQNPTTTDLSQCQVSPSPSKISSSTPNTIVRFHRSLLFIARKSSRPSRQSLPAVDVYNLQNDHHQEQQKKSVLLGKLLPTAEENECSSSLVGQGVTEISIDESCDNVLPSSGKTGEGSTILISVFYTTGQFTFYKIKIPVNFDQPIVLESQEVGSFQSFPISKSSTSSFKNPPHHRLVETAKLHFPLLVSCSIDFHLSFYRLSWSSSSSSPSPEDQGNAKKLKIVKLDLDLQNHSCYWPLSLSIKRTSPEPLKEIYKMKIAYPMPFYPSTWTIGLQEFEFEIYSNQSNSIQVNSNRFMTAFNKNHHPQDKHHRRILSSGVMDLSEIVIGIEQAEENIIVGRSDNTIDCFKLSTRLSDDDQGHQQQIKIQPELRSWKTLFGHTSSIGSITVDENGRCISGAMDGVKVWEGTESVDVQHSSSPTLSSPTKVAWIGSDSEKIVCLSIRENLDPSDRSLKINEEVRVLSFI
ncbi:hypothetical protein PSTG_12668 [Puccinia striiformis f. sp. tritici PST-78]|uniref:F-box domain-containing protein n=1 Tax=Puccinia striiformis f. sp. tritici PST-78 TaxID=1165861 RepID=A0A0L0V406_9BASI|nr:hypothetical protein PSTG_12668 [Puccinia striiformis f. sp. tritici PST-78]